MSNIAWSRHNSRGLKGRAVNWFLALLLPVAILVLWEVSVRLKWVPNTLVAGPEATIAAFASMVKDGRLLHHSLISLERLFGGFAIGTTAGLIVGSLVGLSRTASKVLDPTLSVLAPIPAVAWVPMLIILLGIGDASKIGLVALGTFFIITFNVAQGIRGTDRSLVELTQVLGKRRSELLFRVLIPSAVPQIFLGLRVALALSWTLLLVSEMIASSAGLGWLIWDSRNFSRVDELFVGMIAVGILGRLTDFVLLGVERLLTKWRSTYETFQNYHVETTDYSRRIQELQNT